MRLNKTVVSQVIALFVLFAIASGVDAQGVGSFTSDKALGGEIVEEDKQEEAGYEGLLKALEYNSTNLSIMMPRAEERDEDPREHTTSLTGGYINDEFIIITDSGSDRFIFDGETIGGMISTESASLLLGYGVGDAEQGGDIRNFFADVNFGGNRQIIGSLVGLPFSVYIPIRVQLGYRHLSLLESDESLNIGQGGLGLGLGAMARIPTGIPALADRLVVFGSLVQSVGGLGELSFDSDAPGTNINDNAIDGIRLTQNTDFNIEGKIERLLGENTGVTVGLTLRWQRWTDEAADNFWQAFDVVRGQRDDLTLRGKQIFLRAGINW